MPFPIQINDIQFMDSPLRRQIPKIAEVVYWIGNSFWPYPDIRLIHHKLLE